MKEDRRVQRTKALLRDSLVALILENGYDAVKVSHITEHANLARATFYLHYKDKDDLLTKSLFAVFDELAQKVGDVDADTLVTFNSSLRKLPFDHAQKYRDLYRVALMSPHGISTVTNHARQYISQHILGQLTRILPEAQKRIPLPIVANYMAGALIAVLSWWIEEGEQYDSDYMAETFYWISLPTLSMLLGVNNPPPIPPTN